MAETPVQRFIDPTSGQMYQSDGFGNYLPITAEGKILARPAGQVSPELGYLDDVVRQVPSAAMKTAADTYDFFKNPEAGIVKSAAGLGGAGALALGAGATALGAENVGKKITDAGTWLTEDVPANMEKAREAFAKSFTHAPKDAFHRAYEPEGNTAFGQDLRTPLYSGGKFVDTAMPMWANAIMGKGSIGHRLSKATGAAGASDVASHAYEGTPYQGAASIAAMPVGYYLGGKLPNKARGMITPNQITDKAHKERADTVERGAYGNEGPQLSAGQYTKSPFWSYLENNARSGLPFDSPYLPENQGKRASAVMTRSTGLPQDTATSSQLSAHGHAVGQSLDEAYMGPQGQYPTGSFGNTVPYDPSRIAVSPELKKALAGAAKRAQTAFPGQPNTIDAIVPQIDYGRGRTAPISPRYGPHMTMSGADAREYEQQLAKAAEAAQKTNPALAQSYYEARKAIQKQVDASLVGTPDEGAAVKLREQYANTKSVEKASAKKGVPAATGLLDPSTVFQQSTKRFPDSDLSKFSRAAEALKIGKPPPEVRLTDASPLSPLFGAVSAYGAHKMGLDPYSAIGGPGIFGAIVGPHAATYAMGRGPMASAVFSKPFQWLGKNQKFLPTDTGGMDPTLAARLLMSAPDRSQYEEQ